MTDAVVFFSVTLFTGFVVQFAPFWIVNCNVTLIVVVLPAWKNSPLVTLPVRLMMVGLLVAFTTTVVLVVLPLFHLIVWVPVRTVLPAVSAHLVVPCAVDVNVPPCSAPVQFLRVPL